MKVTQRDKKLVLLLPALAVAIGYCLMVDRGLNARVRQLRSQVARAKAAPASPDELMRHESQLAQTSRELTSAESETQKIRDALAVSRPAESNQASEQVAALLPRHHLALIEQSLLTAAPQEVGQSIRRLAAQNSETGGVNQAAFWRVKFVGTFPDTLAALDELSTSVPRAVPASLSMSDGPTKRAKMWTLVLWM